MPNWSRTVGARRTADDLRNVWEPARMLQPPAVQSLSFSVFDCHGAGRSRRVMALPTNRVSRSWGSVAVTTLAMTSHHRTKAQSGQIW